MKEQLEIVVMNDNNLSSLLLLLIAINPGKSGLIWTSMIPNASHRGTVTYSTGQAASTFLTQDPDHEMVPGFPPPRLDFKLIIIDGACPSLPMPSTLWFHCSSVLFGSVWMLPRCSWSLYFAPPTPRPGFSCLKIRGLTSMISSPVRMGVCSNVKAKKGGGYRFSLTGGPGFPGGPMKPGTPGWP